MQRATDPTDPDPQTAARRRPRAVRRLAVGAVAVVSCGLLSGGVAYAHSGGEGGQQPESASSQRHHQSHGARGTVASVEGTSFVLTGRDGTPVTVTTDDTTTFSATAVGTVADAAVGSYVVIHGKTAEDGTVAARAINVKPAPTDALGTASTIGGWHWRHGVAGTVATNDPTTGVLTITTADGTVTVLTTVDTKVTKTTVATIADVTVGAKVGVRGDFADDGTLAAARVKVLPATATAPPVPEAIPTTTIVDVTTTAAPVVTVVSEDTTPDPTTAPPAGDVRTRGTVATVEGVSFTLTLRDGSTVTVVTNDATEFKADEDCGDDNDSDDTPASLADVVAGAEVKVLGTTAVDGSVVATTVVIGDDHDGNRGDKNGEDGEWGGRHGGRNGSDDDADENTDISDDRGGDWSSGSGRRGGRD